MNNKKVIYGILLGLLIFLMISILVSVLTAKTPVNCKSYSIDTCPKECTICPPCEVCSSISCQTEAFCASMGFNKTWYESVKPK